MNGSQTPRIRSVPDGRVHPDGEAAIELVDAAGIVLDRWQRDVMTESLLVRDGRWAAFEVGLCVPRQNGKSELALARMLVGAFVLGERLIIYTAHLADTAKEMFRRMVELIESVPWLHSQVRHVWRANGNEQIELRSGQRIKFRTRTSGGGRGFAKAACVIFDEAMILPSESIGAIIPIVSASENPQIWYAGSAVDQIVHAHGIQFARVRERAVAGADPSLAYFEWSADADTPELVQGADDPATWAAANPGMGVRIALEHVANEQRSMDPRTFAVERLGVGDWPRTDGLFAPVIDPNLWLSLVDAASKPADPVVFAFDVSPTRSRGSISVAGRRPDGLFHVETVAHREGTGWMVEKLAELAEKHRPAAVICDERGPAGSLIPEIEALGVEVTAVNASEHAQACGSFFDLAHQQKIRHLGTPELAQALRGAAQRPLGEAWAWSRKTSQTDISPLVAATLALWGAMTPSKKPFVAVAFA